jgi:hypothetical protein
MKALISFVKGTVAKEHTFFGSKLKFSIVVGSQMRPTGTPKDTEKRVIRGFTKETF